MIVYSYGYSPSPPFGKMSGKAGLITSPSLLEALSLPDKKHLTVCLVGGGGKTSVMYGLADELASAGKRVIVTTTTHIFRPSDRVVIETAQAKRVGEWIKEHDTSAGCVLAAGLSAREGKMTGLPLSEIEELCVGCDVLLIEADGAKRLPIKVPREGEPVIPAVTDVVIGCVGLDCVGTSMETICFRPELAKELLEKPQSHQITTADVAKILTDSRGTRKSVGKAAYRIVLNKADDEERRKKAVEVIEYIRQMEAEKETVCAVTSFLFPREVRPMK